jgi:hypothetical protein
MARKRNRNVNCNPSGSPAVDACCEDDAVVVRIPVKFYRRNGRQMVLAQNDASGNQQAEPSPNHTLIVNLAKAYQWQEQLESGEYGSLEELAQSNGVDRSYAGRLIRLTSIAPNVVEQILTGVEHGTWSLRQLRRGIPLSWEEPCELWA